MQIPFVQYITKFSDTNTSGMIAYQQESEKEFRQRHLPRNLVQQHEELHNLNTSLLIITINIIIIDINDVLLKAMSVPQSTQGPLTYYKGLRQER